MVRYLLSQLICLSGLNLHQIIKNEVIKKVMSLLWFINSLLQLAFLQLLLNM